MYAYTKTDNKRKKMLIKTLASALFLCVLGVTFYQMSWTETKDEMVSVNKTEVPVISLPKQVEVAIRPYKEEAQILINYYEGEGSDVNSMTKFEGVYRGNQGIDYGKNQEAFDVIAIFSGEVVDVKNDPLFGNSCTIQTNDLSITYQSLKDMKFKVGDQVKQGDAISVAGENVYNKDLGNHLHLVVTKNNILMNPEHIYGKPLEEI